MILDTNTACQFEALRAAVCFFEHVEDSELLRQTSQTLIPLVLDKVGVTRTQTAEIIKDMLAHLIETQISAVLPQLVGRFDAKQFKLSYFCVNMVCAILEERGEILNESQLLVLYKAGLKLLKSHNRNTRELGASLFCSVFSRVQDPLPVFAANRSF